MNSSTVSNARLGEVIRLDDGRTCVRFQRRLNHPVERVWAAITDAEQRVNWFPGLTFECRVGGRFEIRFRDDCNGPAQLTGTVTTYDPPNLLKMGSMRWELAPDGDGCVLTFTDFVSFDDPRSEHDVINSVLGGWHKYLDMLAFALEGGKGDPRNQPEFDYSSIDVPGRE